MTKLTGLDATVMISAFLQSFVPGPPQIDDLIRPAKLSIFFIDEKQVVRPKEIGGIQLIRSAAKKFEYMIMTLRNLN